MNEYQSINKLIQYINHHGREFCNYVTSLTVWNSYQSHKTTNTYNLKQTDLQSETGSSCLPDRSQNTVDSLPCLRPSFHQVSWKVAGDCITNANKPPTMPYSVIASKVEVIRNLYPAGMLTRPRPRPNLRDRGQRVQDRGLTIEAEAEKCTSMGALMTYVTYFAYITARTQHSGKNIILTDRPSPRPNITQVVNESVYLKKVFQAVGSRHRSTQGRGQGRGHLLEAEAAKISL